MPNSFDIPPTSTILNYAYFVKAAYDEFTTNPTLLNPTQGQYPNFPSGYKLTANIQMTDFFAGYKETVYYGFIAQNLTSPTSYVIAIRGTVNYIEWWADLHLNLVPWPYAQNSGKVVAGFLDLYETMKTTTPGSNAEAIPLRETIVASSESAFGMGGASSLVFVGHSLGASLVTIHAADTVPQKPGLDIEIYTLASPCVGDADFKNYYDSIIKKSYRVYNKHDIVVWLLQEFGYKQVLAPIEKDSWLYPNIKWTPTCCHALTTYMYLLNGPVSLLGNCLQT